MIVDHIAIAVHDLEAALETYKMILGDQEVVLEEVSSEGVRVAFFQCGETRIELVAPTDKGSAFYRSLQKRGEGLHHIAFSTGELDHQLNALASKSITTIGKVRPGAGGRRVCFLHPKECHGVLIELVEASS